MAASFLFLPSIVFAGMTSTHYQVPWDEWGSGGDEMGTSTAYAIRDTIGGLAVGATTSTVYSVESGYRLGDTQTLSFFAAMAPVGGTSSAYSGLNVATKTITLSGGSNPFSVGEYVALIENPGLSQLIAVGRITVVDVSTVTVDELDGQQSTMSPTPSSATIVVLSGGNISLGTITAATGAVATGVLDVQAPTPSGYTLFVQSRADLAAAGHTFAPVSDGSVTAGTEEYGICAYGSHAALVTDTPLTTAPTSVQSSLSASSDIGDRTAFAYKVALSASTPPGDYTQSIYFTLTPNY